MPPRGRPVSKGRAPSSALTGSHIIVIGNCRLDVPDALGYELSHEGFSTEIQDIGTLKVYEAVTRIIAPPVGLSFTLLNPKNVDGLGKRLLQDVLHLYNVELPAMSFAANTGKESPFLESCIMDGKYCTLILRKNDPGSTENELLGAVTFQILPPDTQQAEIPLAAVRHAHQRKGYGTLMYKELQKRLVDVGVTSAFCWGDVESEAFWSKQAFVKVAEVDGRGKSRKLPIKGDLKKAMSIPGSATLMISYLECGVFPTTVSVSPQKLKKSEAPSFQQVERGSPGSPALRHESRHILETKNASSPVKMVTTPQLAGEVKSSMATTPLETVSKSPQPSTVFQKCMGSIAPLNMEGKLFSVVPEASRESSSPVAFPEPLEPVVNSLAMVPFSVPDSEPPDGSCNSGCGVTVTDITSVLTSTKSPGPLTKRTSVRRQQTIASSTSVVPSSSGKENMVVVNQDAALGRAASSQDAKMSAFLGLKTKPSQQKDGVSIDPEGAPGQLDSIAERDEEAKLLSLSAFIGPRRKSCVKPSCDPEGVSHGDLVQAPPDKADKNVDRKAGTGAEPLCKLVGAGPTIRGSPTKGNISEVQEKSPGENTNSNDVLNAASGPRVGVKRGRPPKAPTGKVQKEVHLSIDIDQVVLPESGASEQKAKARPLKRGKASISAGEGASKQPNEVSTGEDVSAGNIASEEWNKMTKTDQKSWDDRVVKNVPRKGRPARPVSEASEPKTGLKRGGQAKLIGKRTKLTKADNMSSRDVHSNQRCPEGKVAGVDHDPETHGEDGVEEVSNMLVSEYKDSGGDSIAVESTKVQEDTLNSDSLGIPVRMHMQVTDNTSPDNNKPSVDESLTSVGKVSDSATTTGAESNQQSEMPKYVIMFMNMADENKKRQLSKHVERLGGLVTCEGSNCTHVVTMEVRRTLNFCVAISSGAWILSPDWLKVSVKQKTFVGEEPYILRDKKFEAKYSLSLKDVISKAQQMPNLLLDGLYIYPTPHVHPPVNTISEIMRAAGGQVLSTFEEAVQLEKKSVAIVVACEEDMEQAVAAAKVGIRTYNSDWLLTCIVKQELDFIVPQFTESL